MIRDFSALSCATFDVAIIGGGIHGAVVAREAALRGLKVALVDRGDFAHATSSRSSKLIHGGLRYLEQFEFKLVRESRSERRLLQQLAPHLARPVPFLLPIYRGDPYDPLKIRVGLGIYDLLGNLGRKDRHQMLSAPLALEKVPRLQEAGLRSAAVYYDSQTDDARLTIENLLDAANHSAIVVNYAEVMALGMRSNTRGGKGEICSAEVRDRVTGRRAELAARLWVNATGPWVDHLRALAPGFDGTRTIRRTKGTHIVLPAVAGPYALFAAILPGDRIFLMPPWHGYALLGTTDTDFEGEPDTVKPDRADVEYLLKAVNRVLRKPFEPSEVIGCFAGLRALVMESGRSPSANTREYKLHEEPGLSNFISICGGKLTTSRLLGEQLVNKIMERLDAHTSGGLFSRDVPLPGGHTGPFDEYASTEASKAVWKYGVQPDVAERVIRTYGSRWDEVLSPIRADQALAQPLPGSPTLLGAEVDFAIRQEMAVTLEDFLLRRSGLNWLGAFCCREAVPAVADLFAARLGWSTEQKHAAIKSFTGTAAATLV